MVLRVDGLADAPRSPRRVATRRPKRTARLILSAGTWLVPAVCRLTVTGCVPPHLRRGPLILAANHIGNFDPIAVAMACQQQGLTPRFLATGGLFQAPLVGRVLDHCGHVRVDRGMHSVADAFDRVLALLRRGAVVVIYPEGRITLDPNLWPEPGKTGTARLALASGAPVIPVSQWGSHEVVAYDGWAAMLRTALTSVWRRPTVHVHFGEPVSLADLDIGVRGDAVRGRDRIIDAIRAGLEPLRAAELLTPRFVDPTRARYVA